MGLRILHTADWHLCSPFAGYPDAQRQFLRSEQQKLPRLLEEICREKHCDLVLLAGDIFDGKPEKATVSLLKQSLANCGVPVMIAPGNHDFLAPGSAWLEESWSENVHIFAGALSAFDIPELDCRVYGGGYQSMDCEGLLNGFHAEGSARYCIGILHGDATKTSSPYCPVTAAQVRESGLDYLALGHIHQAGSFTAGSTLCAWPGCPMGRGWDETGEKGFTLVQLDAAAQITPIPLPLPRFYALEGQASELGALLPPVPSSNFFRVTLNGYDSTDIFSLQRQYSHLPHLIFRDQRLPERSLWDGIDSDSLWGEYLRLLQSASAPEDIITLAAEISRKLMDGQEVALP